MNYESQRVLPKGRKSEVPGKGRSSKKELVKGFRVIEVTPEREERFWRCVDKSEGCWNWNRTLRASGYGKFCGITSSRFAYEMCVGKIPEGMLVCHHCDNRSCVRPDHLFIGTHRDNAHDRDRKGRQKPGISHATRLFGESVKCSKLTESAVRDIRMMKKIGVRVLDMASIFGVHKSTIWNAISGVNWSHVK